MCAACSAVGQPRKAERVGSGGNKWAYVQAWIQASVTGYNVQGGNWTLIRYFKVYNIMFYN
jgi:hypothetical protein